MLFKCSYDLVITWAGQRYEADGLRCPLPRLPREAEPVQPCGAVKAVKQHRGVGEMKREKRSLPVAVLVGLLAGVILVLALVGLFSIGR
jgi:hypothetical protein